MRSLSPAEYPFDETCNSIAERVVSPDWKAKNITTQGAFPHIIMGPDFKLTYLTRHFKLSGVAELVTPLGRLNVFDDNSGPVFKRYVGGFWRRDRANFMSSMLWNAKLNNERRTFVIYEGSNSSGGRVSIFPGIFWAESRSTTRPYLVADDNIGRDYGPERFEPKVLNTQSVMKQFDKWLRDNVLQKMSRV